MLLAAGMFTFSVTGPALQTHELRLIGGAYTYFLAELESEARSLRSTYCTRADAAALAQARCNGVAGWLGDARAGNRRAQ